MTKSFKLAAAAAGLAGAAVGGLSWYIMETTAFGYRQTLDEAFQWQEEHYDVSWFDRSATEDYVIKSYDGYLLHASFVRGSADSRKFVIITHGYTDNRYGMLKYLKMYLDEGYSAVIYDIRGHGENDRTNCTYSLREAKDLCAVIEDTYRRYGEDIYLGLHGESLGAATTVRSLMYKPRVRFAVADCGFADITNVLEGSVRSRHVPLFCLKAASRLAKRVYGHSFEEMRPIDALKDNSVPLLFIHGGKDSFVPPENSRRMHEAAKNCSELLIIPEAAHAASVLTDPEQYYERLKAFLDRVEGKLIFNNDLK
ncbi:MAG: alpha/beta hydrolase [Ruminococcus sp.]|nr:alpha/beta hydrolase [Ruminococcus sp.]